MRTLAGLISETYCQYCQMLMDQRLERLPDPLRHVEAAQVPQFTAFH